MKKAVFIFVRAILVLPFFLSLTQAQNCVDSDGGVRLFDPGYIFDQGRYDVDRCDGTNAIVERYCYEGRGRAITRECPNNLSCQTTRVDGRLSAYCGNGSACGNGICESGEDYLSCPQDCPIEGQVLHMEWQNTSGRRIVRANVNESVFLFVNTSLPANIPVLIEVWEEDSNSRFDPIRTSTSGFATTTNQSGIARVRWSISPEDMTRTLDHDRFVFTITAGNLFGESPRIPIDPGLNGDLCFGNSDPAADICDIVLSVQNERSNLDISSLGMTKNTIGVGQGALALDAGYYGGVYRSEEWLFWNASETMIREDFQNFMRSHGILRDSGILAIIDIEWPYRPINLRDYLDDPTTFSRMVRAFKRRIDVVKSELGTHSRVGIWDLPKPNVGGQYTESFLEEMEAYMLAGEQGMFTNADVIVPSLFHRFGRRDNRSNFEALDEYTRQGIEAAYEIAHRFGKKVVAQTGFWIFNGNSLHNREDNRVHPEDLSYQLSVIQEYGPEIVETISIWSADDEPLEGNYPSPMDVVAQLEAIKPVPWTCAMNFSPTCRFESANVCGNRICETTENLQNCHRDCYIIPGRFTSAQWKDRWGNVLSSARVDDIVRLSVQTTFPPGTEIDFSIYEQDGGESDYIKSAMLAIVDSNGVVTTDWRIRSSDLVNTSDYNAFYFKAKLQRNMIESSRIPISLQ